MDQVESPVSLFSSTQLVTFLTNLGITRHGLDSVWEKEVTGAMLCEFCEEDIKDVFTEFKDRFRIRKLLRDIADKVRHKPSSASRHRQDHPRGKTNESPAHHHTSPKMEAASPTLLQLVSSEQKVDISRNQLSKISPDSLSSMYKAHLSSFGDSDHGKVKEEKGVKKQRTEDVSLVKIPEAHTNSQRQSRAAGQASSSLDAFMGPPASAGLFLKPDFVTCFMNAHPLLAGFSSHSVVDLTKAASGSANEEEEQALCLKKSPQRIVSPTPRSRSEMGSPATQPSSTTPDYLQGLDPSHLDLSSVLTMGGLASKYSAGDILSKKSQRSRPNSAQKLGSILIRSAAQHADLWASPPHLRNISQTQKDRFLSIVYQVAPHIRDFEHLLWQRLSETLQNRRKYLLDKKLGKRGLATPNPQSPAAAASSLCLSDLSDISEWQVTSMQGPLLPTDLKEDASSLEDNGFNKDVASVEASVDVKRIKTEPVSS